MKVTTEDGYFVHGVS